VARYAYLGNEVRSYPQYLDVTTAPRPLEAIPGRSYAIAVVPGWTGPGGVPLLPVPPADGRWPAESASVMRRKAATV
jgi:hypothetical protein